MKMITFIKNLFKPSAHLAKRVKEGAMIIDVRTNSEYLAGHIKGSRNIPLDAIKKELAALKKLNKPIVTVCRSGNRSNMARSVLISAGMEVYNGGAWTKLNKQIHEL